MKNRHYVIFPDSITSFSGPANCFPTESDNPPVPDDSSILCETTLAAARGPNEPLNTDGAAFEVTTVDGEQWVCEYDAQVTPATGAGWTASGDVGCDGEGSSMEHLGVSLIFLTSQEGWNGCWDCNDVSHTFTCSTCVNGATQNRHYMVFNENIADWESPPESDCELLTLNSILCYTRTDADGN